MANEHTLVEWRGSPAHFIVADGSSGTDTAKGSLMILSDPRTVAIHASSGQLCAGVLAREKIGGDGRVSSAVHEHGKFRAKASGAISAGDPIASSGTVNLITASPAGAQGAKVLGIALEDIADNTLGEYELNIGGGGS